MRSRVQDPWALMQQLLLTDKLAKLADVRSHVVMALRHLDGWVPLAALVPNPMVHSSCCACAQLAAATPAPQPCKFL
jgi:hypothetical protein